MFSAHQLGELGADHLLDLPADDWGSHLDGDAERLARSFRSGVLTAVMGWWYAPPHSETCQVFSVDLSVVSEDPLMSCFAGVRFLTVETSSIVDTWVLHSL